MKISLTKRVYQSPYGGGIKYFYVPLIDVFLVGNHKVGKSMRSYIDTGATFNIFPYEYAEVYLGFTEKTLEKGTKLPILGVGGYKTFGFGHICNIQHPNFCLKDVMVFFVKGQSFPLLGLIGFVDKFKKVTINNGANSLEIEYENLS